MRHRWSDEDDTALCAAVTKKKSKWRTCPQCQGRYRVENEDEHIMACLLDAPGGKQARELKEKGRCRTR